MLPSPNKVFTQLLHFLFGNSWLITIMLVVGGAVFLRQLPEYCSPAVDVAAAMCAHMSFSFSKVLLLLEGVQATHEGFLEEVLVSYLQSCVVCNPDYTNRSPNQTMCILLFILHGSWCVIFTCTEC